MSRPSRYTRYRPPSRTVRLLRANVVKVLDLYAPALKAGPDGSSLVCVGCGGRMVAASPEFVAHTADCPEVARYFELDHLLTPVASARKAKR